MTLIVAITGCLFAAIYTPLIRAAPNDASQYMLDDFESGLDGWKGGNKVDGKKDYFLAAETSNHFLRSKFIPGTKGEQYKREIKWDSDKYPVLEWRWRVNKFPAGAKIVDDSKSDAACQVYVIWKVGRIKRVGLKYFWSESDPVGTEFVKSKPFVGKYEGIVIRMGGATGVWMTERRNIREDYKKAFGEDPPKDTEGIAILTDGDATETTPAADYDDFRACER